jgi:hypothetical protein
LAVLILIQLALPLVALAWLALARFTTQSAAANAIAATAALIAGVLSVGVWVYPPLWLAALLFSGLLIVAGFRAWRRVSAGGSNWRVARQAGLALVSTALGAYLMWHGVSGRLTPQGQILDLAAPFEGEGYCVISGGASPLLNFHMATLAPGREAYRGQSYGADFIAVSRTGFRTIEARWTDPQPSAPSDYRIFGAPIHAPCTGLVLNAGDGLPDQQAGVVDRTHMEGNHVTLRCEGYDVLLAHMRQGSVRVSAGERVEAGALLGEVGNTGNSDEPHLHLSAQRAVEAGARLGGQPVPLSFNGRYLARGGCL